MLVRDLFYQVAGHVTDTSPQFDGWEERAYVDACNAGQTVLATFLPQCAARVDAVKLRAGSYQRIDQIATADIVTGDGAVLTAPLEVVELYRAVSNMGTDGLTPGRAVRTVSGESLDAFAATWQDAAQSYTIREIVFDPRNPTVFMVSPPAKASTWLRLAFRAKPIAVPYPGTPGVYALGGASSQVVGIADAYCDALANYMAAYLLLRDGSGGLAPLAQVFIQLFTGFVNAQVQAFTGNNPNLSVLPMAPSPAAQAS